jgi:Holliday junction resolvase RusA-like endonuclease
MKIFIPYDFTSWNDYIREERSSLYKANHIKQSEKHIIALTVKDKYKGGYPVTLLVKPHFKNKRRDLDNYRLKGLIDGLVCAGVIKNDNLTCIDRIILEPVFTDSEGVEIEIRETKTWQLNE